ncbi:hypothetical protein BDN70DRAFT_979688, partial [Pholiota conissans]
MGRRKGEAAKKRKLASIGEEYISSPETGAIFAAVSGDDFVAENSPHIASLLNGAQVSDLLNEVRTTKVYCERTTNPPSPVYAAIAHFEALWKAYKGVSPTHWKKRYQARTGSIRVELGLKMAPYSILPMIKAKTPRSKRPFGMNFVERAPKEGIKRYHYLYDRGPLKENSYIADTSHGYYKVPEDESAIFYSYNDKGEIQIEMAVIRDAVRSSSFGGALYDWL